MALAPERKLCPPEGHRQGWSWSHHHGNRTLLPSPLCDRWLETQARSRGQEGRAGIRAPTELWGARRGGRACLCWERGCSTALCSPPHRSRQVSGSCASWRIASEPQFFFTLQAPLWTGSPPSPQQPPFPFLPQFPHLPGEGAESPRPQGGEDNMGQNLGDRHPVHPSCSISALLQHLPPSSWSRGAPSTHASSGHSAASFAAVSPVPRTVPGIW